MPRKIKVVLKDKKLYRGANEVKHSVVIPRKSAKHSLPTSKDTPVKNPLREAEDDN